MVRFEITGCATDVFTLAAIQSAIKAAGAKRVRARKAFGWRNQPAVATFAADNGRQAKSICEAARLHLGAGSLPALLPRQY